MTLPRQRWIDWLAGDDARDNRTGLWLSWVHPQHPGYAYEEATAWVILAAAGLRHEANAHKLVDVAEDALPLLGRAVAERGGLGRDGRLYAFDTAVGLAAWQAWQGDRETATTLLSTLRLFCDRQQAVEGGPTLGHERASSRWSESWGGHLLWLARPLTAAGDQERAGALVEELSPVVLADDGLLRIHSASDLVYAHGALYGAEGLLAAGERERAAQVVTTLLAVPTEHGLVPAWPQKVDSPGHCDATAQALMLAAALDATISPRRLTAARDGLARFTSAEGGLRYSSASQDVNCCATAFALRGL